ncbi:MAG: HIT family protein [Nanoarchaeota archaeon]|nr:HIT family protein [Nanoarchaeota archaeon]
MVKDCIFCKIISGKTPCWKVYEDSLVIAFFDVNPAAEGHILVVPKKHFQDIFDIEEEYIKRIASVCKKLSIALRKAFGVKDINLIHGSGKNAQQDVFHFHMHIWPREAGDKIKLHYKPKLSIRKDFDKILKKIKKCI